VDDAVAGVPFPEVLDAGACVCAAVPDFFVFAPFFVAFESLLDGSPVCGADCDRAVTTPPGHSRNARRISWTTVRCFRSKLLLHHGERAPLRHTQARLGGCGSLSDVRGASSSLQYAHDVEERLGSQERRVMRYLAVKGLSAGDGEWLNRPRQRCEPLRRIRRAHGAWDRVQRRVPDARAPETRW
jgi:hypothetical protein